MILGSTSEGVVKGNWMRDNIMYTSDGLLQWTGRPVPLGCSEKLCRGASIVARDELKAGIVASGPSFPIN